jgi:plastocyanin
MIMNASQQEKLNQSSQPQSYPPEAPRPRRQTVAMFGVLAAMLVVVLAATLFAYFSERSARPVARPTPTAVTASCNNNTVFLGVNAFVPSQCTIKAGETISFYNPPQHSIKYFLYLGVNGIFQPNLQAPAALNNPDGIAFDPGSTQSVIFAKAGQYHLTVAAPGAQAGDLIPNLTITVLAS